MTVSSILPTSFTFTKESELRAAGTEGLSPVSSSNDSLEEDSLKEVSAISSWMISSLLLLLVSEHSLVLLDKTSSLDLSSEFWELRERMTSLACSSSLSLSRKISLSLFVPPSSTCSGRLLSWSVRCFTSCLRPLTRISFSCREQF